jgi:tetratricopeptide (TPR) repeat protein
MSEQDYLGARILIKSLFQNEFDFGLWREVRKIIYHDPRVGYDLVFALERHPVKDSFLDKDELNWNELSNSADKLMLAHKYSEAYDTYSNLAAKIKTFYKGNIASKNQQFYFYLLHQMARTLFALKNYKQAFTIYTYIPKSYYQNRQIQFEKMWTAFYINKIDQSIGSIISQRSPFFSRYLEPEAYIVQLYVLRKLCRYEEGNATIKEIKLLEQLINNGKFTMQEWARMDIETISIFNLIENKGQTENIDIVNEARRKKERKLISDTLQKKYKDDLNRLREGYSKILSFSILSKKISTDTFGKINSLPNPKILYATGFEYWPKDGPEDWMDEFGTYYFIGESNCKNR